MKYVLSAIIAIVNKKKEFDLNIIEALKSLPHPLKTFDGHEVLFDENKRHETIFEHIANKNHHLHVADIHQISSILLCNERKRSSYRT